MTDIIEQAKAHQWWYSDQSMSNNLIHEIEQLREQLKAEKGYVQEYRTAYCRHTTQIAKLAAELRRCVEIIEREVLRPDGSTPDTCSAHALLGDFDPEEESYEYFNRYIAGDR